jgi:hypothetical protein
MALTAWRAIIYLHYERLSPHGKILISFVMDGSLTMQRAEPCHFAFIGGWNVQIRPFHGQSM